MEESRQHTNNSYLFEKKNGGCNPRKMSQSSKQIPSCKIHNNVGKENLHSRVFSNLIFPKPFSVSPFAESVRRIENSISKLKEYFPSLYNNINHNFFSDNFSSNFSSTFDNPLNKIIYIQSVKHENKFPLGRNGMNLITFFLMNDECTIKNEINNEYPCCSKCAQEIGKGSEVCFLPCGHLFHKICALDHFQKDNCCSLCKFPIPEDIVMNNKQFQNKEIPENKFNLIKPQFFSSDENKINSHFNINRNGVSASSFFSFL
jgi:hypothetical protein